MDIVKFQNNIDKSKQNIKDQRNKIYTYLSRDKNYSKTLKTKRAMLYLSISALIIVSIVYSGILYTKSLSNADKSSLDALKKTETLIRFLKEKILKNH